MEIAVLTDRVGNGLGIECVDSCDQYLSADEPSDCSWDVRTST